MKTVPDFHDFLDVTRNERTRAVAQLDRFDRSMIKESILENGVKIVQLHIDIRIFKNRQ